MDISQVGIATDTDALASAMLNVLNREGYINNATYLAAKDKLKEDGFYVKAEQIRQEAD